jgi:hypothetical protein
MYPQSIKILVRSSTLDSGIQNQWQNSPKQSLLESSCVVSCVGPGRVKYLYQHDFYILESKYAISPALFLASANLRLTENSHETVSYLNAQELMDSKSNASRKVKSMPKSKNAKIRVILKPRDKIKGVDDTLLLEVTNHVD